MDLKFTKAVLKESSENKQNIVLLENPGLISYGYLFRKRKYLKDILVVKSLLSDDLTLSKKEGER